jgi:methyltransferase (TIGR00027 family)
MSTAHKPWDIVSGVGVTALAVALARALESRRADALVWDPFAEIFVAACELPPPYDGWPAPDAAMTADLNPLWASMPTYLGIRSRFFDEYFAAATASGIRQVVILAAGLDSRAFRLDWPAGTRLFEIDQALVLSFKNEVLGTRTSARCARQNIAADLRDDWAAALRAGGFDTARPTAWLAEGLLPFLPPQTERDMFATVTALSAPGSRLAVEAPPGDKRDRILGSDFAAAEELLGVRVPEVWQTELRPEPDEVLRAAGWRVTTELVAEAGRRYGREVTGVMTRPALGTMLLTALR